MRYHLPCQHCEKSVKFDETDSDGERAGCWYCSHEFTGKPFEGKATGLKCDDAHKIEMLMNHIEKITTEKCDLNYKILQMAVAAEKHSTGKFDKNNKIIHAGDFVKSDFSNTYSLIKYGEFHSTDAGDEYLEYGYMPTTNIGFYWFGGASRDGIEKGLPFGADINGKTDSFEIIGNIRENIELMQGVEPLDEVD